MKRPTPWRVALFVGTHEAPFERMVRAAERLAEEGVSVRLQHGHTRPPQGGVEGARFLSPALVQGWMREADAVVTHGGPALLFEALGTGLTPVVLPRDPRFGEHVDAHQLAFAARLGERVRLASTTREVVWLASQRAGVSRAHGGDEVAEVILARIREAVFGGSGRS